MKKYLMEILLILLLCMLLPGASGEVCCCDAGDHVWGEWSGFTTEHMQNYGFDPENPDPSIMYNIRHRECLVCGLYQDEIHWFEGGVVFDVHGAGYSHEWSDWTVQKKATCEETGIKSKTCARCGQTKTETIPKSGHEWIPEYDDTGLAPYCDEKVVEYCLNCGELKTVPNYSGVMRHHWSDWKVTKKATCKQNGTKTRICSACGKQETESISKSTAHQFGDWEVSTEVTCTKDGKEKCFCKICGASKTRVVEKLGHNYSEYEIIVEATDCSKGKRASTCARCGKQLTEEFYPEGTLYKGGNNPPEAVKALQTALADLGLYKNKIVGEYGNGTFNAVSKFEKDYLGMKGDGIAWPKVIRALGVHRGKKDDGSGEEWDEGPVSSDTSRVRLLLEVEQVSARWDYAAGDTITIQWTLTNLSEKDEASSIRVYQYNGMKADKKKDREIAQPENLAPGGTQSGTFEYTITAEDEAAGKFSVGFIARCRIRKKDESSNRVWFNFHTGAGEPEVSPIDWTSEPDDPPENAENHPGRDGDDSGKPAPNPDDPPKDTNNKPDKDDDSEKPATDSGDPGKTDDDGAGRDDDGSWTPPSDDGDAPADGNTDPAIPGTACGKVLIAESKGTVEYEITQCEKHEAAAAASRHLMEAGDYTGAVQTWDDEIAGLYGEWSAHADAADRNIIAEEQAVFAEQMKALDESVRLVCSEEEAARIAVKERMDKCVSLCNELHTAPAPRTDSFSGEHTVLQGSSDSDTCSREAFSLGNGTTHVVNTLCEAHQMTMKTTRRLLEGAGSNEEKTAAWQQVQKNWLLELNAMYDPWYLSADKSLRDTIAADRLSFDKLIEARKKTLALLYPNDPATAAETLANMIMERTELICGLLRPAGILDD